MENELSELMREIYFIIHAIAGAFASLRLSYGGLKYMAGNKEELANSLRQVIIGLIVIYTSPTIVWVVTKFGDSLPKFNIYS